MRRRRFYGKPLPPKRQVRAHLSLLKMISEEPKMDISLTEVQRLILQRVLFAEVHKYTERTNHAASHGQEYAESDGEQMVLILEKLDAK